MKICRSMFALALIFGQTLNSQEWKPDFTALEFEESGISIEFPNDWYAMNNGALKNIRKFASDILKKDGIYNRSNLLVSMMDKNDINDNTCSLINIQFLPEFMLTQKDVADASPAQVQLMLDYFRSLGFDEIKKIAHSARLVDDGKILKIGMNWYVKITMEIQMREDLPTKTKEMFFHMSNRGIVIIGFTYMHESEGKMVSIRDYVTESLRTNILKRTQ